jgi:hypothetical protein
MYSFNYGHVDKILIVTVPPGMDTPEVFKQKLEDNFYPFVNQYVPYALAITAILILIRKL